MSSLFFPIFLLLYPKIYLKDIFNDKILLYYEIKNILKYLFL